MLRFAHSVDTAICAKQLANSPPRAHTTYMSLQHRVHEPYELEGDWGQSAPDMTMGRAKKKERVFESGDGLWSTVSGMVGGGIGGVAMVAAAEGVSRTQHLDVDYFALAGAAAHRFPGFGDTEVSGALFAAFVGAIVGGLLGFLSRRATRVLPRLMFFLILTPPVWVLAQAFVIQPLSPWTRTLPAVPLLVGSLAYGLCLALSPPIVRREKLPAVENPGY
jgi:hypothetical protein